MWIVARSTIEESLVLLIWPTAWNTLVIPINLLLIVSKVPMLLGATLVKGIGLGLMTITFGGFTKAECLRHPEHSSWIIALSVLLYLVTSLTSINEASSQAKIAEREGDWNALEAAEVRQKVDPLLHLAGIAILVAGLHIEMLSLNPATSFIFNCILWTVKLPFVGVFVYAMGAILAVALVGKGLFMGVFLLFASLATLRDKLIGAAGP